MDAPRDGVAKGIPWVPIMLILVPTLYVLSYGPAAWLTTHGVWSHDMMITLDKTVYAPIRWLMARSVTFLQTMIWYCRLFTP